jgi:hypothetical protein
MVRNKYERSTETHTDGQHVVQGISCHNDQSDVVRQIQEYCTPSSKTPIGIFNVLTDGSICFDPSLWIKMLRVRINFRIASDRPVCKST